MSNTISFVGRLSRDAEVNYTASGTAICNLNVANDVGFGDNKVTNWFRVAIFGKRAEGKLVQYLVKGTQVFIAGELKVSEYTTKEGEKRQSIEVAANVVDLVGGKSAPKQDNHNQAKSNGYQEQPAADFDDDLPPF